MRMCFTAPQGEPTWPDIVDAFVLGQLAAYRKKFPRAARPPSLIPTARRIFASLDHQSDQQIEAQIELEVDIGAQHDDDRIEDGERADPDEIFPYLTKGDVATIRATVRRLARRLIMTPGGGEMLQRYGLERWDIQVLPDRVVLSGEVDVPLESVMQTCHASLAEVEKWQGLIQEFFVALLRTYVAHAITSTAASVTADEPGAMPWGAITGFPTFDAGDTGVGAGADEHDGESDEPDEQFPYFTKRQVADIRRLAHAHCSRHGEVRMRVDRVILGDDYALPLEHIMVACRDAEGGPQAWDELVKQKVDAQAYVRRQVALPTPERDADGSPRVYPLLFGRTTLMPGQEEMFYLEEVGGDLVHGYAFDYPDKVANFLWPHVWASDATLHERAMERLAREEIDVAATSVLNGRDLVTRMESGSHYVATKVLDMPKLLERIPHGDDCPHGVLVSVPGRHVVSLHRIGQTNLDFALNYLASDAMEEFSRVAGPVSPFVHWWKDGIFRKVSSMPEPGTYELHVEGELAQLRDSLAHLPPA